MFNLHEISKNFNKFKGFQKCLMMFMILHAFTTYSIGKMRLRPNPMQSNNKNMNFNDLTVFDWLELGKSPCGQSQRQQKHKKHDLSSCLTICN